MAVGKASIKRAASAGTRTKKAAEAPAAEEVKAVETAEIVETPEEKKETTAPKTKTTTRKPRAKKTVAAEKEAPVKFMQEEIENKNQPVRLKDKMPVHLL